MKAVYAITNLRTGHVYVGASAALGARWASHLSALSAGKHPNATLQADWKAGGAAGFTFAVLEVVANLGDLRARELAWKDAYRLQGATLYSGSRDAPYSGRMPRVRQRRTRQEMERALGEDPGRRFYRHVYDRGQTYAYVAKFYGVSVATVGKWLRAWSSEHPEAAF